MNNKINTKIYFIIAVLVLMAACTQQTEIQSSSTEPLTPSAALTLETDKDVYHSGETMNINVNVVSNEVFDGDLMVYGINSRYYRLNKTKEVNLTKGLNTFIFEYKAPSCNTCSGIRAGAYDVTAKLTYQNETIANSTISVDIQQ